jgi:hypothetical protein
MQERRSLGWAHSEKESELTAGGALQPRWNFYLEFLSLCRGTLRERYSVLDTSSGEMMRIPQFELNTILRK